MGPSTECLFCKIVAGDVPATVVREDERTLAFRDINPQAPTHVLVITREHLPDIGVLADAEAELSQAVLAACAAVASQEGVADSGYRVVFNTGSGAGQTVPHVHAHVLGGRGLQWPPG